MDNDENEAKGQLDSWNVTWWEIYLSRLKLRQIKPLFLGIKPIKTQWLEHICSLWELKHLIKGKHGNQKHE